MASVQAPVGIVARQGAAVPHRLSAELSELLREVRDVTAYARRAGLEAVQSGGASYEESLGLLFEDWMQSTSRRRQIVSFASAADLGVPLGRHRERCKAFVDEAGMLSWRALFLVASTRMCRAERRRHHGQLPSRRTWLGASVHFLRDVSVRPLRENLAQAQRWSAVFGLDADRRLRA
ncbi:hypothetical protein OR16_20312 [Cupriavidus basilensis OR16]|uniref:Uncharacterized protein n=1 Tax=Cupriavidus basilensis OR16 TaxID=1127483 RepID=H1S7W8_9BURK|nr:hypothetical protein [Cupriavidus basilensis]EHP41367.1 hypothetical protein OR16_20312 [Cupriavidus basilensis OR16]